MLEVVFNLLLVEHLHILQDDPGRLTDRLKKRKFDALWTMLPDIIKEAWEQVPSTVEIMLENSHWVCYYLCTYSMPWLNQHVVNCFPITCPLTNF